MLLDEVPLVSQRFCELRRRGVQRDHLGFYLGSNGIKRNILVPKYYTPEIDASLEEMKATHELVSLGSLAEQGAVSITTGIEIGKMAYGTGQIPFIRTSDLSNWEIKADFKHGVSDELYEELKGSVDVQPGDILMVRDGTYLVGTVAMITESDVPMLFQSHLFRIRVLRPEVIDPYLLFISLTEPIVKAQVRSKQFTQDIIDTLGQRVLELLLPIPRDEKLRKVIAVRAKEIIDRRARYRDEARSLPAQLQGIVIERIAGLEE